MNKRTILAIIVIIMPSLLLAQSVTYTLNVKVAQLDSTAKAYLIYSNAAGNQKDSALMRNGLFVFAGAVDQPVNAYLTINNKGTGTSTKALNYINLYLETGAISVISMDSLINAKISGGPVNADNERLKIALAPITKRTGTLKKDYQAASDEKRNSKEFSDEIKKMSDSLETDQKAVYLAFIKANPNSVVSLAALKKYVGNVPDAAEVEPAFNLLSVNIRESKMGIAYAALIATMKKTALGAVAPDFTQADTSGKLMSLHNFKGKYVLVDFWASWCGPCRAENPNVLNVYNKYHGKGFTILGVSLDGAGEKAAWTKAISDDHLTWAEVSDLQGWKNGAAQLYAVKAIPQNFLIDPDGKIVAKNLRGDELEIKLEELLGKN